jgi:signal transduction histidine kinase
VPALDDLLVEMGSSKPLCLPVPPQSLPGLSWAVPLWSERGLIGIFLLGEKRLGSLYTQEEIEIARTVGERLIDIQASAEMARRLMTLQRQHLAESQVIDRRTRRSLHDDILPELHTAILALSGPASEDVQVAEVVNSLSQLHAQIADLLTDLPAVIEPEISRLGLVGALQQTLEREFKDEFDQIDWQIAAQADQQSRSLPPMHGEVFYYAAREAIRNAAQHGRGPSQNLPLQLSLRVSWEKGLRMTIEDNGVGIQKTPSEEGATNHPNSGRGLALHSTLMAVIGGSLTLESSPGSFTRVTLFLPEKQA